MPHFPAKTLKDARVALDGYRSLQSTDPDFNALYVPRPATHTPSIERVIDDAIVTQEHGRPLNWFFSGHTGAGKSTELSRLAANERLRACFIPCRIDIEEEYDVHNLRHEDILHGLARGCIQIAKDTGVAISKELQQRLDQWGKEVTEETSTYRSTEGEVGGRLELGIPYLLEKFAVLGEHLKSGGEKRTTIHETMNKDLTAFIRLIDDLAAQITAAQKRQPLIILDGLDHVDHKPCITLFTDHFATITKAKVAKLFVVRLGVLSDARFNSEGGGHIIRLPNIKVFSAPDQVIMDPNGWAFFQDLISRHADLSLFEVAALDSLFRLSAGLVRDMLRLTSLAAGYARDAGDARVTLAHARHVWDETKQNFLSILNAPDYVLLRKMHSKAPPEQWRGDGQLLALLLSFKAVVFYPNGKGWYGVHPAVAELLDES